MRHIFIALLAAAGLGLLAAGGVSCGGGAAPVEVAPSPDTLALVEGLRLFEVGEYDLAREQFSVSALSESTHIRTESFLYLNALEMELGNYEAARPWLDKYHMETMRLLRSAAEASTRAAEQAARLSRRNDLLTVGVFVVAIAIAVGVVLYTRRRQASAGSTADSIDLDSSSGQRSAPPDPGEWNGWLADAETFKHGALWEEISALAAQKPGREAAVLTSARQDVLDGELSEVFAYLWARLRADYPSLTAGDVKLCCLSLLPLSPFGRALCYGSTETNIIKQRKHTIKKKLTADARGRALFDFIFEKRD